MKPQLSHRDYEQISAYLDGGLKPKERARVEARLQSNDALQAALQEIRKTRSLLRSLPRMRSPRNFTLTPAMVGKPVTRFGLYPSSYYTLRLSAVLSSVLLVCVLIGDFLTSGLRPAMMPTMAPMPAQAELTALPAATQAMVEALKEIPPSEEGGVQAPSAPMPTAAVAADMFAANVQTTQPPPALIAVPTAMALEAAQPKQAVETLPPSPLGADATSMLALAPQEAVATAPAMIAAPPGAEIAVPTIAGIPPAPEQKPETGLLPAKQVQPQAGRFAWRIIEVLLALTVLVTGLAALTFHKRANR
jgi:anti-sigma factor RsiW